MQIKRNHHDNQYWCHTNGINFHLVEKGQGIVDDDDENTYPGCTWSWQRLSYPTPFFGGKHPFFKRENTLFIRNTKFLTLLRNSFHWGDEAQVFGWKLPHPKVDRVLVLPVVGFEPGSTDIAPSVPSTGPFSVGPTKLYCQFNPIHYYGATYTNWFSCNLIG